MAHGAVGRRARNGLDSDHRDGSEPTLADDAASAGLSDHRRDPARRMVATLVTGGQSRERCGSDAVALLAAGESCGHHRGSGARGGRDVAAAFAPQGRSARGRFADSLRAGAMGRATLRLAQCARTAQHHLWFDVAYTFDALWQSRLVQAVLSLLWTSLALGTVVLANRRQWRGAWIAGAALLAIVVAKLFFVDLSRVGGLERIISFIGVGLLLLLVGYLAPVPPKRANNLS